MSKTKLKYICTNCGYESLRWIGKCPECASWNTFTEELVEVSGDKNRKTRKPFDLNNLNDVEANESERLKTGITEFDRVLGNGLMPGSVVLLGGEPGIGKSTLVMQAAAKLKDKVLYVTGEESAKQIKTRASRLKVNSENFFILTETELETILNAVDELQPKVVIIDSIQTTHISEFNNSAGTITQIRESTSLILEQAKKKNFCAIIIGHVTKEGIIAGPKILEHIVDTVIHLEGQIHSGFRILRAQKNRFGSTNEIGIFEMHSDGMTEVKNPSKLFLSSNNKNISGSVVTAAIEGTRPILLEVQALVTPSHYGNPQRVATGFDYRRLSILLAVLEKRANFKLSASNVFLNMAGGVKIYEPAADLAVCCAIASNLTDKPVKEGVVVIGEVGLGGEVRNVSNIGKRIAESEKLGFKNIIVPNSNDQSQNLWGLSKKPSIQITPVNTLSETIGRVLG